MTKNKMGKKSYMSQDGELEQNLRGLNDEIADQPNRPFVHKRQPDKSSKDEPQDRPPK